MPDFINSLLEIYMDNDVDYTNYDNKYKMTIRPDVLMMHNED